MAIYIKVLEKLEEFEATLEVQKAVWGFSEVEQVPSRLFTVCRHIGGLVLGAYDGERIVGFSLAMPGVKPAGGPYWHSHMTGVLPPYQNRRIGRQLKLRQRLEAIQAGIELVEWTFDPLEIRNAYFNLERLGVIARHFLPNHYGFTSSHLHGSLPTDRLVAEWHVKSPRAQAVADRGERIEKRIEAAIEVPAEIGDLRNSNIEAALAIQSRLREQFQERFAQGLAVVGCRRMHNGAVFELGRLEEQPVGAT